MEYTGEYTGPYWSNGKIQESVEWGDQDPKSQLDWLSRQHDSAYAHFKDAKHREAADLLYMKEAKQLAGRFPELAGSLVGYGNYTARQIAKLGSDVALSTKLTGNPLLGVVKYGLGGISDSYKRINGTYLKNELSDIKDFYKTDPFNKPRPNTSAGATHLVGSLERTKGKGGVTAVASDGQRNAGIIPGRPIRDDRSHERIFVASLNAPHKTEAGPEPIVVGRIPWFHKLRKKKKRKNNIEPLEARIQRLTLGQEKKFDNYNKTQKNAKSSKLKTKPPAFGFNRIEVVRSQAKSNKNTC
nr:MAG: hypothetical protein 2 [Luteoviridae sp.]